MIIEGTVPPKSDFIPFKMGISPIKQPWALLIRGQHYINTEFILQALRSCIGIVLRTQPEGGRMVKNNGEHQVAGCHRPYTSIYHLDIDIDIDIDIYIYI